jgi:hypothetical protein
MMSELRQAAETLADYERMLDAEIAEATARWAANNHDWQRSWDYLLGLQQAKDLLKIVKMGPIAQEESK